MVYKMTVVERNKDNGLVTVTATLLLMILLAGQVSLVAAQGSSIIVDSNYDALEISDPDHGGNNVDIFSPVFIQPVLQPVLKLVTYQTEYCLRLIHVEKRCYSYSIRSPPSPF